MVLLRVESITASIIQLGICWLRMAGSRAQARGPLLSYYNYCDTWYLLRFIRHIMNVAIVNHYLTYS